MSLHSYTKILLHIVWGTLNREKILNKEVQPEVSEFLYKYAKEKKIPMIINYVNADHVHALIDLPTGIAVEDCLKLLKGGSSFYINKEMLLKPKLTWARGYGAFSVSESARDRVIKYIMEQEEHHRKKTFSEEYERLVEKYGLKISNV